MEFAGDYSWGYDPAHIFAVESAYDGHPASATLVLPPYSASVTKTASQRTSRSLFPPMRYV